MFNLNEQIQVIDVVMGDFRWEYQWDILDDVLEIMGGLIESNCKIVIYGIYIIDIVNDDYFYVVDIVIGEFVWECQIFDYWVYLVLYLLGLIVVNGKIIFGRSCCLWVGLVFCVIIVYDVIIGKELWCIVFVLVLGDLGNEIWGDVFYEECMYVGLWMVFSYDLEFNFVYVGILVMLLVLKFMFGGFEFCYLYYNLMLVIDVDIGDICWQYQYFNDYWDLDYFYECLLVDMVVVLDFEWVEWINLRFRLGEICKVIIGILGKIGVVYIFDWQIGEFFWVFLIVVQNVISNIDGVMGVVMENIEVVFIGFGQEVLFCLFWGGGKNWLVWVYSLLMNIMFFFCQ